MRVIFMGTPDFAVGTLEAVIAAGHHDRGSVWTDFTKRDLRDAKIRLCQCTCFFASEIPRGSTDPVGGYQRRCSFGSDDHAYGRGVRYR